MRAQSQGRRLKLLIHFMTAIITTGASFVIIASTVLPKAPPLSLASTVATEKSQEIKPEAQESLSTYSISVGIQPLLLLVLAAVSLHHILSLIRTEQ